MLLSPRLRLDPATVAGLGASPWPRQSRHATLHIRLSATVGIEGVLVHGAQGVRSLFLPPVARGAGNPKH